MGRHARGGVRSRLTTTVGIAVPVAVILAAGSWWAVDASTQPTTTVTGSAVVVSSLACRNGDQGTVVDLLDPVDQPPGTARRATLDTCGHRPGEVLAVDYSIDDPARVVPAATDPNPDAGRRLMPLGMVLVALLGVASVVAVFKDARRLGLPDVPTTADRPRRGRHARSDDDDPPPPDQEPWPAAEVRPTEIDMLFPDHDRLAANLHDELFTHRSPVEV